VRCSESKPHYSKKKERKKGRKEGRKGKENRREGGESSLSSYNVFAPNPDYPQGCIPACRGRCY
jgi:hypothetical protein